jgi:hypothetical protein
MILPAEQILERRKGALAVKLGVLLLLLLLLGMR